MSSKTQIIPLVTGCIQTKNIHSCLDCGCGFGKWAGVTRTHLPQMSNAYIVGLDIFLENLKFCKKYGAYDDLVLGDINYLPFKDNFFDVIIAGEVIEHIEKQAGKRFLYDMERISKGRVVVTTPNGSWPDNPIIYKDGKVNVHEHHKSVWHVSDFSQAGYRVHAIGLCVDFESKSLLFRQIISGIDFLLFPSWIIPQLGKHLVAYKDKSKNRGSTLE